MHRSHTQPSSTSTLRVCSKLADDIDRSSVEQRDSEKEGVARPPNPLISEDLLSTYDILSMLGEGTYGMVYKCRHKTTGKLEAVKLLRYDEHCERFALAPSVVREISILKNCKHPNIIELYDISVSPPNHLSLHFELMRSDLRKYIFDTVTARNRQTPPSPGKRDYGLPMHTVKLFTLQLLIAIRYAHCQHLVHRDLKPQNLLVNESGDTIKIGDWGLSRPLKPRHAHALRTREVVTLWYRSPELLLGCQRYGRSVDMWSIGVIIYHMVTGVPLFHCPTAVTNLIAIFHLFGTPRDPYFFDMPYFSTQFPQWDLKDPKSVIRSRVSCHPEVDDDLCDLLTHLLALNPNSRWSARQAIWHPFLDDVRASYLSQEKAKLSGMQDKRRYKKMIYGLA